MNLMKKLLLFIIAIEVMVVLQILFLDNRIDIDIFNNNIEPSSKVVVPKVTTVTVPLFTPKEEESLLKSMNIIRKEFSNFIKQNSNLDFLYSKEVDYKRTEIIESYAKKFLGTPYVWGAIGPDKFDCSGFTQKIYRKLGIKIPRYSGHQAEIGTYIKYENLERGDMVFFDTNRKETGRVNHVGIYLEDGKFIHASSGNKKVVITNFNEKLFYKNRFLWGRRVIQNKVFKTIPTNSIKYFFDLIV